MHKTTKNVSFRLYAKRISEFNGHKPLTQHGWIPCVLPGTTLRVNVNTFSKPGNMIIRNEKVALVGYARHKFWARPRDTCEDFTPISKVQNDLEFWHRRCPNNTLVNSHSYSSVESGKIQLKNSCRSRKEMFPLKTTPTHKASYSNCEHSFKTAMWYCTRHRGISHSSISRLKLWDAEV